MNQSPNPPKCSKCEKKINDKKPGVKCDCCKIFLCSECAGLSATESRVLDLKTSRVLTFMCPECRDKLNQLPTLINLITELKEEIRSLKRDRVQTNIERTIEEWQERMNRAKNVILFGVPESTSASVEQRKKEDSDGVAQVLSVIPDCERPIAIIRLGKPQSGHTTPRPLKLVMSGKQKAIHILKNKSKLPASTSVKSDLTPCQRNHLKKLREELADRLGNGEADITIKYVNNYPKIVKMTKN